MNKHINFNYYEFYDEQIESKSASLIRFSYNAILNSKIGSNIDNANALQKAISVLKKETSFVDVALQLSVMQIRLYKHLDDDIQIVSCIEHYAKGVLLKKKFVIHKVSKPNILKEKQPKNPILFEELNSNATLRENETISCSTILSDNYADILNIPREYREIFRRINQTRNLIHMHHLKGFIMEDIFIEAILWLRNMVAEEYKGLTK